MNEIMTFHYDAERRTYEVYTESGKPLTEVVDEFIKTHRVESEVLSEEDYKIVWAHRTAINNLMKKISSARKQTTAVVINPLDNACKPLEKRLQEVSDELTAKMLAFKPKEKKPKETTIITIELPFGSDDVKRVKSSLKRLKIAYKEEEK